jgi:hypothetical protein
MNDEVVISKILGRIGSKVAFTYPVPEGNKEGILKDRVVIPSVNEENEVPYWDVVDLIEFSHEKEKEWIRIGYYRKPKDKLIFASQTTITEPISIWKKIFMTAAQEKPWFRDLLFDVVNELKKQ